MCPAVCVTHPQSEPLQSAIRESTAHGAFFICACLCVCMCVGIFRVPFSRLSQEKPYCHGSPFPGASPRPDSQRQGLSARVHSPHSEKDTKPSFPLELVQPSSGSTEKMPVKCRRSSSLCLPKDHLGSKHSSTGSVADGQGGPCTVRGTCIENP